MTRYPRNLEYLANDPHWIYTIWRDDECLYVGMTSDWRARTSVHVRDYMREPYNATHIDVWAAADNRTEAERLESQTIVDLDPKGESPAALADALESLAAEALSAANALRGAS